MQHVNRSIVTFLVLACIVIARAQAASKGEKLLDSSDALDHEVFVSLPWLSQPQGPSLTGNTSMTVQRSSETP